jgi:hypothetical protein
MFISSLKADRCIPLTYAPDCIGAGSRVGGLSPTAPRFHSPHQRHFATLEFEEGYFVSVFYSFDVSGSDSQRDLIDFNNRLLLPPELLHAVVRPCQLREGGGVPSEVTCHLLEPGSEIPDVQDGLPGDAPCPGSKLGGEPFIDNVARCGQAFQRAVAEGYRQLAQLDTPNPRTQPYVKGFPWDPGTLHVLFRGENFEQFEFAFVIQQ